MLAETGKLKSTAIAIGTAISSFINGDTMSTTIDKRRLAQRAGVSMETLRRNLPHLQKVGFLVIEERVGRSHKYTITLHNFDESKKTIPHHIEQGAPKQIDVPSKQNSNESLHDSSPYSIQSESQCNKFEEIRPKTY